MITPATVTIVVNGSILSSFLPARIRHGRVVAPLTPVLSSLATRVMYGHSGSTVTVERGGRRIVVPVVFVEHDVPFVELAPVVRGIGGSADFDAPRKTLAISFDAPSAIATPAPFDPRLPEVAPHPVFTAPPPPEPPRGLATGIPHPRRTAIPVIPSQPVIPEPGAL